jgi:nitroreductase
MNQALQDVIEHRRTTNFFEPNHTISDEEIEHLVRLATRAPTSFNLQNWRFLAVRTPERKAKLRKLAYDQAKVSEAAVTFIVCGQLADYSALEGRLAPSVAAGFMSSEVVAGWVGAAKALYDDKPQMQRDEAIRSATFGAASLLYAAEAHGFGSSPMIGFDPVAVASEFSLLPDEIPVLLVAIGRAATNNWPQKSRRPLTEVLSFA